MEDLGEILTEARKRKRLSQEELAERLGVSRQTVSKWETNQSVPTYGKLKSLVKELDLDSQTLLAFDAGQSELTCAQERPDCEETAVPQTADAADKSDKTPPKKKSVFFYIAAIATLSVLFVILAIVIVGASFAVSATNGGAAISAQFSNVPTIILLFSCIGFVLLVLWLFALIRSMVKSRKNKNNKG